MRKGRQVMLNIEYPMLNVQVKAGKFGFHHCLLPTAYCLSSLSFALCLSVLVAKRYTVSVTTRMIQT
jgi:hypothetical protein